MDTNKKLDRDHEYFVRMAAAKTPEELETAYQRGRMELGDLVWIPSNSAPTGWRRGTVIGFGPKRVKVSYKFKNGRESEKTVLYQDAKTSAFPPASRFVKKSV